MAPYLTNHDKEIITQLHKKNPISWTLIEAKVYQQWAWEEDRNGKICAELLEIGYESCKTGLRRYNLQLRKKGVINRKIPSKWTREILNNIIHIKRTTNKNFKQIADELGYPHKVMYNALGRSNLLTPDIQRPLTRNKKSDGFALDAHLGNIAWNSENELFKRVIKSEEDFGSLGRPG